MELWHTITQQMLCSMHKILQSHCICYENDLFKSMKVTGDGSCLYRAIATHIMLTCLDNVWAGRFPPGKKPRIKPAIYEVVNDLKQFISQKDFHT